MCWTSPHNLVVERLNETNNLLEHVGWQFYYQSDVKSCFLIVYRFVGGFRQPPRCSLVWSDSWTAGRIWILGCKPTKIDSDIRNNLDIIFKRPMGSHQLQTIFKVQPNRLKPSKRKLNQLYFCYSNVSLLVTLMAIGEREVS